MSRPLLRAVPAAVLLAVAYACVVPELPWIDGKACDDVHLCVRGVCLAGQCVLTPPGQDASTTPVLVTRALFHAQEDGSLVPVPDALSGLELLEETADGGFIALQAEVADAGLGVFWDAPPGQPYLIHLGQRYFASDAGLVDLSEVVLGRTDLTAPSAGTALRAQFNCISPWDPLDEIQLTSAGTSIGSLDLSTLPGWTPPSSGSGSLNTSVSWTTPATPGLIQTSAGDHPVFIQLEHNTFNRGLPDAGLVAVHQWMGRRAQFNVSLDMQDGVETALSQDCIKDMNPRPGTQFTARGSAFGSHLAEAGGGATLDGITATVGVSVWPAGPGPDLYRNGWATPDDVTVSPQVPNNSPFPAAWTMEASVVMTGRVPLGSTGNTAGFAPVILATRRAYPLDGGELAPALSPPRAVLINGEDASSGAPAVGEQPEVTWTPPALGTPAAYVVEVWREQDASRVTDPQLEGTIWTAVPRVRLPPGLLAQGSTYVLHVRAVAAPIDARLAPLLSGLPYDEAEVVTGLIAP